MENLIFFKSPLFFISMATAAKFVQPMAIFRASTRCGCDKETLLQNFVKLEVNLKIFAPWLP
jgi:hypothetical protein